MFVGSRKQIVISDKVFSVFRKVELMFEVASKFGNLSNPCDHRVMGGADLNTNDVEARRAPIRGLGGSKWFLRFRNQDLPEMYRDHPHRHDVYGELGLFQFGSFIDFKWL